MRLHTVFKVVGPVIIAIGIAMILTSGVSLLYHERPEPLLLGGGSACAFGMLCVLLFRKANTNLAGMKEGCAIVTFSWLLCCIFGGLPFAVMHLFGSPTHLTLTQSFYEAVSGFTTTGASILTDVEILPRGILFWRSFTHWFGGMGIVVFAVAILPKLGIGGMQAFRWESPGPLKSDKLVPRISDSGRMLYTVYMGITVVEVLLLLLVGVHLFDALVYTFGTVGTGGFGVHNASVAGLKNPAAEWIIGLFMWLSGMNFALIYGLLFRGQIRAFLHDTELRVYTAISLGITGIIALTIIGINGWNAAEALRYAFFQVSTIITTTGYATYDYNTWPVFAIGLLCPLLFIGGCTGSTGGGPKVLRHIISWKFIRNEILKLIRPNLVTSVHIGNRPIDAGIVSSVMGLLFVYFIIFFVSGVLLTFFAPDIVTAFSASIANLGNIGPGFNAVGPAGNYAGFPAPALWILSTEMLLGRLEVYTMLILLVPTTWRRTRLLTGHA